MKRRKRMISKLDNFPSGARLGGTVSRYQRKNIYTQGAPAYTLFYIQDIYERLRMQALSGLHSQPSKK
jgi:hypothetical protein